MKRGPETRRKLRSAFHLTGADYHVTVAITVWKEKSMSQDDRHDRVQLVAVAKRRAHAFEGGGFMYISQEALKDLAKVRSLGSQAVRVWFVMLGNLGFENRIVMDAKSIADELDMSVPNVYGALKRLKDMGLIEHHPTMRRDWRISPHIVWKGSIKEHKEALKREAA
jgi:DNA-binding transcriptional ArsR family regulator